MKPAVMPIVILVVGCLAACAEDPPEPQTVTGHGTLTDKRGKETKDGKCTNRPEIPPIQDGASIGLYSADGELVDRSYVSLVPTDTSTYLFSSPDCLFEFSFSSIPIDANTYEVVVNKGEWDETSWRTTRIQLENGNTFLTIPE